MRIVFAGTPDAAVPSLRTLAAQHDVAAVVTRPDAPRGRRRVLTPSAVAHTADELGLPVIRTRRLDDAATEAIARTAPDLGVIVAYGALVREPLLSRPAHGWINLHFSLLPRWRGAAPVQHALIAGDTHTGASVFRLGPGLDDGDILGVAAYDMPAQATAGDVLDALAHRGAYLLSDVVDRIAAGEATGRPQTGEVTRAPKPTLEDARLRFTDPQDAVVARWQGVTPEPGAHTTVDGVRLKVLTMHPAERTVALAPGRILHDGRDVLVGTATEPVVLDRVQPAGRAAMDAGDWWRGLRADDPVAGS